MTIRNDDSGLASARAKKRALEQKYAKAGGRPEQAPARRPPRGKNSSSTHETVDMNRSYDLSADWDNDHNNRSFNGSYASGSGSGNNLSGHIGKNRRAKRGDARSIDSGMSGMSGSNGSLSLSRPPKQKTKVKLRDTDRLLRRSNHGKPGTEMERAPSRGRQMTRQGSGMVRSRSSDGASVASAKSSKSSSGMSMARENSLRGLSVERTGSKRSASAEPTNRRSLSRDASTRGRSSRSASQEPTARGRQAAKPLKQEPSKRKGMSKQASARPGVGSKQVSSRPGLGRQGSSRRGLGRQGSARSGMSTSTGSVRSGMSRQSSSRPGIKRQLSDRPGKMAMERELSERALREEAAAKHSKRGGFFGKKPRSARIQTGAGTRFEYSSGKRRFIPRIEKAPPKSLVLIWIVVTVELMMDLVTTIISFAALVQEDDCCGEPIQLGFIPMTATVPFFLLIVAEVAFLGRAIKLTMCPPAPELERRYMEEDDRWCITKMFCCCLRWNARMLFRCINWLVLLNPFFGAVVAWMLLYQSSKVECFVVLGLEGASLFLHFLSIYLEGERQTRMSMFIHLLPILPFLGSVILILVYLQQGGVCYLVESSKFWYDGCRVCENGLPPVDNVCVVNETVWNNYTDPATGEFVSVKAYNIKEVELDLNPLFATQDTYCANGTDPSLFCFFTY